MDITVQELREKLRSGDGLTLIDVRQPEEHADFNVGGVLIPVGELINRMYELEDHKDTEIVVYCRSGGRSAMAQAILSAHGFRHVRNLIGGMLAWQEAYGNKKA